jgi:hypothetical protein
MADEKETFKLNGKHSLRRLLRRFLPPEVVLLDSFENAILLVAELF